MGSLDLPRRAPQAKGEAALFVDDLFQPIDLHEHEYLRKLVPVVSEESSVYLNASFQQPMNLCVKNALDEYLVQASTQSHPKPIWQAKAATTKEELAKYLGVSASSLAFTRDTTEGLNLFQRSLPIKDGDNVVVLDVEHPNHVYGWLGLVDQGLEVRRIETGGDTFANANSFADLVDERTIAIGISSVMFHSGQLNDIADICSRYRSRGVHVLVDLTQHVGVMPLNLSEMNVSAAAFGCHKGLGCPTGLGVLYIDPNILPTLKRTPPIVGAGAVANLRADLIAMPEVRYHDTTQRYEHLNVCLPSIIALNASLELITKVIGTQRLEQHLRSLGKQLGIFCKLMDVRIVGSQYAKQRSPHCYVLDLLHEQWQEHFKQENIFVSHYRCGVRVSFGFYNTATDVLRLVESIKRGLDAGIPRK